MASASFAAVRLLAGSLIPVDIVTVITGFAPRLVFGWLRRRRIERIEQQLPDALLMIAGAAKAGLSLVSAVRQVSAELAPPLVQEFRLMQHEQRLGVSLDDTLENLTHRIPVQSVSLMVSAMRIAAAVPEQDRAWFDAPPWGYRLLWWPVQWLGLPTPRTRR